MIEIYCLLNTINNKRYVGQTSQGITERWHQHCRDRKREKYQNIPLQRALNKYGTDSFEVIKLGVSETQERADNLEKIWIILLRSQKHQDGYNVREGGSRGKNSPETCAKISAARKGQPSAQKGFKRSPETCAKLSRAHKGNNYCLGRVLSEETKSKIGVKSKGRMLGFKHSEESKEKIRLSKLGKVKINGKMVKSEQE